MNELKQCTKCKDQKKIISFGKSKHGKNGLSPVCKVCVKIKADARKEYYKEYRLQNKEKNSAYKKEYRKKNLEKLKAKEKIARATETYKEYIKKYRIENKEVLINYSKEYYAKNKEQIAIKIKERNKTQDSKNKRNTYTRNLRKNNINYKLSCNLRARTYKAISRNSKKIRTFELIGCTITELKFYIADKFTYGMTWENYGEWHIDHIRPCASFDLSDPEQQKVCFHYTNLQPLWAKENFSKGAN